MSHHDKAPLAFCIRNFLSSSVHFIFLITFLSHVKESMLLLEEWWRLLMCLPEERWILILVLRDTLLSIPVSLCNCMWLFGVTAKIPTKVQILKLGAQFPLDAISETWSRLLHNPVHSSKEKKKEWQLASQLSPHTDLYVVFLSKHCEKVGHKLSKSVWHIRSWNNLPLSIVELEDIYLQLTPQTMCACIIICCKLHPGPSVQEGTEETTKKKKENPWNWHSAKNSNKMTMPLVTMLFKGCDLVSWKSFFPESCLLLSQLLVHISS